MDNEKNGHRCFTDGEYVFSETDDNKQFYFYRVDGEPLGEVGRLPMDMYQNYMVYKIFEGNLESIVMNNIEFERSADNKCIRLTVCDLVNDIEPEKMDNIKVSFGKKVKTLFKRRK